MKPTQPLRQLGVQYNTYQVLRELEHVHATLNERLIAASGQADLAVDYAAADLGTAANIAEAFNLTNTAINAILAKLRISS